MMWSGEADFRDLGLCLGKDSVQL